MILALKIIGFLYVSVAAAFLTLPAVIYFYTGEKQYMLPFFLPGIDHNTHSGYWILSCAHVASVAIALFGLYSIDSYLTCSTINAYGLVQGFENELNRLRELCKPHSKINQLEIKFHVRNIILMHLDIRRLVSFN